MGGGTMGVITYELMLLSGSDKASYDNRETADGCIQTMTGIF